MINSRNEIMELLNEYMITDYERVTYAEYVSKGLMLESNQWSGKRQAKYTNGVVLGKFREDDATTRKILKEGVTDEALHKEIRINLEHNIKMIEESKNNDFRQQEKLKCYKNQQYELSTCSIDEWVNKNYGWIKEDTIDIPFSDVRVLLYLYYAFENYSNEIKNPFYSDLNKLKTVYDNILDKHSQFHKYGIVPIDSERELLLVSPPRIYDKSINKTFFTKNIPFNLLSKIVEMISSGIVKDFSVRLLNEPGYLGKLEYGIILEEVERGKVFDFSNLGDCSISRLYSSKYENCMWVVIDPSNITFEELYDDFDCYDEMIVTQVVHLEYKKEGDSAYITHLDHEYIFYTIDEYDNRMSDVTQKGTAKARMKSFKIDNSRIPFEYRCKVLRKDENGNDLPPKDEQFLCYVLECYFKHKDLLKEYFHKVLS